MPKSIKVETDIAEVYRQLAEFVGNEKDKRFNKILKKIKKEASCGKFNLKIKISEDEYEYMNDYKKRNIIPDLFFKLMSCGFEIGNHNHNMTFIPFFF